MAYYHTYTLFFNSRITENIEIQLHRKDVEPDSIEVLKAESFTKRYLNGDGKFEPIISSEINFGIWLNESSPAEFDTFIVSFHDEWKVIAKNDGQTIFVGFLVPTECETDLRDKPYSVYLTATDCLAYLKNVPLVNLGGDAFDTAHRLDEYLAGALKRTGLDLNIKIYTSIADASMDDRNTVPESDMFRYQRTDYRTFLKNATEFVDCYRALEILLTGGYSLYQYMGEWLVFWEGDLQESVGPKNWWTLYNSDDNFLSAGQDLYDPARIGKELILHPINANQRLSARFALKYSRASFSYGVWPEIPLNNRFERGTLFNEFFDDDEQLLIRQFTIDDWDYGNVDVFELPHPSMTPTPEKFYRESRYNSFGVEVERCVVGETVDNVSGDQFWLRSQLVPVKKGSKIKIGGQKKFSSNFASGSSNVFTLGYGVYIVGDDGSSWSLDNSNGNSAPLAIATWHKNPGFGNVGTRLEIQYAQGGDTTEYGSFTCESESIPVDGDIYVVFQANGPISNTGNYQFFKDFDFQYFPYVAGGFVQVSGDYWQTTQNPDYKDVDEVEVYLSNSSEFVLKGTLLTDGYQLSDKTWHRLNVVEFRDYKELINLARYNSARRRMWQVSGDFGGTFYHPSSDESVRFDIGFHKHFYLANTNKVAPGTYFQLVPPLTIDYADGSINGIFVESLNVDQNDGLSEGDVHEFKYIFKDGNS